MQPKYLFFFNFRVIMNLGWMFMYTTLNKIDEKTKANVIKDYFDDRYDMRTIKKRYGLFRNEILAIVGQEKALVKDYSDGIIGSSVFAAISDTHIGSIYEKEAYYDCLAEYLTKYGITDAIIIGDLLQSSLPPVKKAYKNPNVQVKHALDIIPEIDKMTWHILFGNHDLDLLNQNPKYYKVLKSRPDFHMLGFRRTYMQWGKLLFSVVHPTKKYKIYPPNINADFRLYGHKHYIEVRDNEISLPPFCLDTRPWATSSPYPGFIIARRFKEEVVFYYFAFEEKLKKNATLLEIKEMCEKNIKATEMGAVLRLENKSGIKELRE